LIVIFSLKGSDASWKGDVETPPQFLEFSDDEEEQKVKRMLMQQKKSARNGQNAGNRQHKPTAYEERMNMINIMKTAECNRNRSNQRVNSAFNPFSGGSRGSRDTPSAVNWATNSNVRFGGSPLRFVGSSNWNWTTQAPSAPAYNSPSFMRAPRFAVPPPDWGHLPFRAPSSVPPPIGTTPSAAWFMLPPPSPPPGT